MEAIKHEHEYVKIGFKQAEDRFERYSIRKYKCKNCGKVKEVDGRFDNIG